LAGYLAAGAYLMFGTDSMNDDALSRVGNAYYVLFSRQPHLAAVGFVWPPLPSLLMIPFLPLKVVWPDLVERGFVAIIESAAFMAGSVYQVRRTLDDLRVVRPGAWAVTLLFGLHPMIVYAGANGLSEAPFIFLLLVATRQLLCWLRTSSTKALVFAGLALSLAYLARYEGLAAATAAVALVAVVSYRRAGGDRERRRATALADSLVLILPVVFAALVWAAVSWLIIGSPVAQFTSVYGNSSQLRSGTVLPGPSGALRFSARSLRSLEPLLPLVLAGALAVAVRRRDPAVLAPLFVLGAVPTFAVLSLVTGKTGPGIRYFVVAVPLVFVLAAVCLSGTRQADGPADDPVDKPGDEPAAPAGWWRSPGLRRIAGTGMVVVGLATGLSGTRHVPADDRRNAILTSFRGERAAAAYLDSRRLPEASVVLDAATGYAIVLASHHPDQFVITSDRDFDETLADPRGLGVRYLMVPTPTGYSALDALNRAYPGLYGSGAGIATLERGFPSAEHTMWRLYRLDLTP
jgi:hypothetical protein